MILFFYSFVFAQDLFKWSFRMDYPQIHSQVQFYSFCNQGYYTDDEDYDDVGGVPTTIFPAELIIVLLLLLLKFSPVALINQIYRRVCVHWVKKKIEARVTELLQTAKRIGVVVVVKMEKKLPAEKDFKSKHTGACGVSVEYREEDRERERVEQ